jgi:DNA modification methylase
MNFLQGDCLEVMKTLPDKSVDCFICDLPYGCLGHASKNTNNHKGVFGGNAGCDWDIKINLDLFWKQIKRLAKNDNTPVLMFCTTKFGVELISSNPDWFRYDLVWSKPSGTGFLAANKMPLRSHEMIYVFSKKGAYYKRTDIEGDFPKWLCGKNGVRGGNHADSGLPKTNISGGEGKRCVLSVIECKTARSNQKGEKKEFKHPTQKPAELYEWLLKRYCPEKGMMLDPTAGSFTSCFTANKLGIESIGIELNEEFYEKACKELIKFN